MDNHASSSSSLLSKLHRSDTKEKKTKHFKGFGHIFHYGSKKSSKQVESGSLVHNFDNIHRRATIHEGASPLVDLHELNTEQKLTEESQFSEPSSSVSSGTGSHHYESTLLSRHSLPQLDTDFHSLASLITVLPTQTEQKEMSGEKDDVSESNNQNGDDVTVADQISSHQAHALHWDQEDIDVDISISALRNLDATIKQLKDALAQMQKNRENDLARYLTTLDDCQQVDHQNGLEDENESAFLPPKLEESQVLRSTFQDSDRQYTKRLYEIQDQLMALECMRQHIDQNGIPKGKTEKEYLKTLRKCRDQGKPFGETDENVPMGKKKRRETMPILKPRHSSTSALLSAPRASFVLPLHVDREETMEQIQRESVNQHFSRPIFTNGSDADMSPQVIIENPVAPLERPSIRRLTPVSANSKHSSESVGVHSGENDTHEPRKSITSSICSQDPDLVTSQGATSSSPWQSKLLDEIQALRGELLAARENNHSLEEHLLFVQHENDATRNRIAQRVIRVNGKIEGSDARLEEIHKQTQATIQDMNTKLKNIEQHFELRFITLSRKLEDQVESVKNRLEQLRISVNSLSDPRREQLRWYQLHRSDHTLHNHLLTSLLHLFAFLAILLSSSMNFILKGINCAAHLMQQRFGPALVLLTVSTGVGLYWWSPGLNMKIHEFAAPLWSSVQRIFFHFSHFVSRKST